MGVRLPEFRYNKSEMTKKPIGESGQVAGLVSEPQDAATLLEAQDVSDTLRGAQVGVESPAEIATGEEPKAKSAKNTTAPTAQDKNRKAPKVEIPASCRDLEPAEMSKQELIDAAKKVHGESLRYFRNTSRANAQARVCAWTTGRILLELKKHGPKQQFRKYAKNVTNISDATISRYMKLASVFSDVGSLLDSTSSLRDCYLKTGSIMSQSSGESKAPQDPVEQLMAACTSLQKQLRHAVQKPVVVSGEQQNQLRLSVREIGGFIEKLRTSNPDAATS